MGTRGAFGFHVDGQDLLSYNQFDSYPEGHGQDNLKWLRTYLAQYTVDDLRASVRALKPVSDEVPPTEEDIEALTPYTDLQVSERSTQDWYCLTRHTHGSLEKILACGYILLANDFIYDSLFCEWAYIVNLDTQQFEIYEGFQKSPPTGRYAHRPPNESGDTKYYPCALLAALPFSELPEDIRTVPAVAARYAEEEA